MTEPRNPFGSAYDPAYLGNNFAELKKYQYVMHKRGRAIYWVDQNERDWINSGFRRRIMQNIIGDAAVEDAFLCVGTGASNNFDITGGDSAPGVPKHFYLGGYPVIVELDTTYDDHRTDLNEDLGDAVPFLTTPNGSDRTDEIYLDIYFIDVKDDVDAFIRPDNALAGITNRWRLISEIKVAENGVTPASPFVDGTGREHHTVKLATLERFDGQAVINPSDITDVRRTFTYGTIANGGLALTDPGGFQAAIDFTSGGPPSMARHVILGTDTVQSQLDQAVAGNQMLVNSSGMQDALDNVVGVPGAGNPVVLASDVPAPTAAGTSWDNTGTGLTANDVQDMGEQLAARGSGSGSLGIYIEVLSANTLTVRSGLRIISTDGLHTHILTSNKSIDITGANGLGGLDTGAEAISTQYAIIAVGDSAGVEVDGVMLVAEANIGSITFPAGYDTFSLLGWVFNDASSNFRTFVQVDHQIIYNDEQNLFLAFNSASWADADTSAFVSPSAALVDLTIEDAEQTQINRSIYVAEAGRSGSSGGKIIFSSRVGASGFGEGVHNTGTPKGLPLNPTKELALRTVGGSIDRVNVVGYYDRLVI